ncbi:hypothetical protein Curi_c26590 [Gottschalkia acidurici 9a]|uniref:Putative amidase domain-containing protein n=1 Tax=Gottschalkia acidurici (strain ATCC 7906 / DSM 604 / BCRC 14475 / CIP 104303 / KCTC 5404 / NCIMB 10678 / 9a) TaxID=1128398 RepID=K0B2D2_GOTA9|nr:amidase domain-containing protein [Gottschalkia acidurici]AFS79654.1 hypothetical protein Curi_c26590 [Gottschalkia acidurici 9a]
MKFSLGNLSKKTIIKVSILAFLLVAGYVLKLNMPSKPKEYSTKEYINNVSANNEIDKAIQEIFDKRNKAILDNDTKYLESIYDREHKAGTWAYEHEVKKIKYISNWEEKQGAKFIDIKPKVIIKDVKDKGDKKTITLLCSTEYKYIYEDNKDLVNTSRIGAYHVLDVVEKNDSLVITKEWYNDPFADSLNLENLKVDSIKEFITSQKRKESLELEEGRENAVEYAHKYSGAASEEKYGFKYNNKYKNYNYEGGDCTNFISQVLHEGGGFKKDSTWNYSSDGATKPWVNAQGFKDYIVYSGKGSVIDSGDYEEIYQSAYNLLPGDIVSYEEDGKIAHTAVVTDFDSKGYPLVTCHNTDRNNVPWDLGWNDSNIRFWFIKVNY